MISNFEMLIRLALACLLGGLIGMERERSRHPAGLRTHILVCVGATLVMLCNIYVFEKYAGLANVDPARLGAQVISGIGFLGAGTILKEGTSIRGLTTAASLWTVACLGIAVGLGYYTGAILSTSFILMILIILSRFVYRYSGRNEEPFVVIKTANTDGQLEQITKKLREFEILCSNISAEWAEDNLVTVKIKLTGSKDISNAKLIEELHKLPEIKSVQIYEQT